MINFEQNIPSVSVVMATNTVGEYFEKAVKSVTSSLNVNWELVIVFDAIPIPPLDFLKGNSKIKSVCKEIATGLPDALNLAVRNTSNELIARLDSDDLMSATRLYQQARFLLGRPEVSVIGTSVAVIDQDDRQIGSNFAVSDRDCRPDLIRKNVLVHSSVMFRKSEWSEINGYNTGLKQMEDYELWLRLGLKGEIWNLSEILTSYRIHNNQMSLGAGFNKNYIKPISEARKTLSQEIELPSYKYLYFDLQWKTAQFLRSLKLRKKFSIQEHAS